ncbi:MAG: hypothetical protein B5M56_08260 [Desulfococcus sp. 4484_241]|nr:MAG: hypothetical protein B5M56_08260 [Desulfococcus sp. 4484_241]
MSRRTPANRRRKLSALRADCIRAESVMDGGCCRIPNTGKPRAVFHRRALPQTHCRHVCLAFHMSQAWMILGGVKKKKGRWGIAPPFLNSQRALLKI